MGSGPGPGGGVGGQLGARQRDGATAGAVQGSYRGSWAEMLGSTLPQSWNLNVLEVVLEKDDRGAFNVSDVECAHMMKKLGLDQRPGVHVEAVQICPNGRGFILITLKKDIDVNKFCRYDVLEVTASGIRVVNVKPAGKRDVVVNIKGLHPNTRDDGVIDYLGKFGKIATNKVVYGTFGEGPLKGIKNGDRAYKIEINPKTNIGTYHVIDGQKVTVRYPGQQQTCARCHETAVNCRGGGIARKCEAAGGPKVELSDYILGLWQRIGYVPGAVELAAVYDDHGDHDDNSGTVNQQVGGRFTPEKQLSDPEKFGGVTIKQFPKETDTGDIMEFLVKSGLPESLKENAVIKPNGNVTIRNLENPVCLNLIDQIHNKKHFGKKLFCNGIVPLTPEKLEPDETDPNIPVIPVPPALPSVSEPPTAPQLIVASPEHFLPAHIDQIDNPIPLANIDLVRRHSLSLRSPPPESIASQILKTGTGTPSSFERTKSLLSDLRGLKEQLSDFGSCRSSLSLYTSSESSGDESEEGFNSSIGKARGFKNKTKRKAGKTPIKEDNVKKANTAM